MTLSSSPVTPEIGAGADGEILELHNAVSAAKAAERRATEQRRKVADTLDRQGLSGREIAYVLKVSPQRVSQLLQEVAELCRTTGHRGRRG